MTTYHTRSRSSKYIYSTISLQTTMYEYSRHIVVYLQARSSTPDLKTIDHRRFVGLYLFRNTKSLSLLLSLGADPNRAYNYHYEDIGIFNHSSLSGIQNRSPHLIDYKYRSLHNYHSPESMRILLDAGADPNQCDILGYTALHRQRHPDCIKMLLDAGANINSVNNRGRTALYYQHSYLSVQLLISHGAIVDMRDSRGFSPLHNDSLCHESIQLLVDNGCDVNCKARRDITPIHVHTDHRVLDVLARCGADINAVNTRGNRSLDIQIEDSSLSVLLSWGADASLYRGCISRRANPNRDSVFILHERKLRAHARLCRWSRCLLTYRLVRLSRSETFCRWWYSPQNIGGIVAKRRIANSIHR